MKERCQPQISITGSTIMELPGTKVLKEQPEVWVTYGWKGRRGCVCLRRTGKGFLKCGHLLSALAEGTQQSGGIEKECHAQ